MTRTILLLSKKKLFIERYTFFVAKLATMSLLLRKKRLEIIYLHAFEKTHCINN